VDNKTNKALLKKNALFTSSSFIFISAVNFLTIPFLVGEMNIEVYGIFTLLTGLFGYFGIFDFGMGQALIKFVSEYHANDQKEKISPVINSCLLFQIIVTVILIWPLYIFSEPIVRLFNVSAQNFDETVSAFNIALVGLLISFISATFSSVLMGLQRYDLTSSVDSIGNVLLNLTLVGLLFYSRLSLFQAVLISVLFSLLILFVYVILIKEKVPYYKPKLEFDLSVVKKFIRYSINIFLSKLSALFSTYLVRFFLTYFLTPAAVTLYVVPNKLLGAVGGVLSSGANSLFPFISTLHARNEMDNIRQSYLKATSVFAGIAIPAFLFIAFFSKSILSVWMGTDFAMKSWIMLSIISISSLIASATTVPNLVILGMGNSKLIAVFSIVSIGLYVLFLPWFTSSFGLVGCAVALLINSAVSIGIVFKYCLRYLHISFSSFFRSTYNIHLLPVIFFTGIAFGMQGMLSLPSFLQLVLGVILVSLYYLFLYIKLFRKNLKAASQKDFLTKAETAS